jgi:hypothetical protein
MENAPNGLILTALIPTAIAPMENAPNVPTAIALIRMAIANVLTVNVPNAIAPNVLILMHRPNRRER